MADPLTGASKTGAVILGLFGIAASPLAGDWVMVAMGAAGGSALELVHMADQRTADRWWRPPIRFAANVIAALIFSRALASLAFSATDPDQHEAILMAVAGAVAFGWRHILPAIVARIKGKVT